MNLSKAIGEQLRNPEGFLGRLTGHAMRIVNSKSNVLAIDALDIKPKDAILELGCGPGYALTIASKRASLGKVCGIDNSSTMVQQARKRNRHSIELGRVQIHQGTFRPLPFLDSSIDKILAVNVIYFWNDAHAILKECRRVLRPGGKIAIYATDAATMRNWKFASNDTHILYTSNKLVEILEQSGFHQFVIKTRALQIWPKISGLIAVATKE